MAVAPVAREERILAGEMRADPDGHGFLARRQMRKSRYLARGCESLHLDFEGADAPQRAIHLLQITQGGRGGVLHGLLSISALGSSAEAAGGFGQVLRA